MPDAKLTMERARRDAGLMAIHVGPLRAVSDEPVAQVAIDGKRYRVVFPGDEFARQMAKRDDITTRIFWFNVFLHGMVKEGHAKAYFDEHELWCFLEAV